MIGDGRKSRGAGKSAGQLYQKLLKLVENLYIVAARKDALGAASVRRLLCNALLFAIVMDNVLANCCQSM